MSTTLNMDNNNNSDNHSISIILYDCIKIQLIFLIVCRVAIAIIIYS